MSFRSFFLLAATAFLLTFAATANACKCGGGPYTRTAWGLAQVRADNATVIFEGKLVHFEMRWRILEAPETELTFSAQGLSHDHGSDAPHMVATLRVLRSYKGDLGPEVQLNTGMGGGDCGAGYFPGLTYLIYAGKSSDGLLWVSMCSPGGWIDDPSLATDLRYLRHEHPLKEDLRDPPYSVAQRSAENQVFIQRRNAEFTKRWTAATGKVCGKVARAFKSDAAPMIALLPVEGYSPIGSPYVPNKEDGSFCSLGLGPGKYYLFARISPAAAFYPGVVDRTAATPIEVIAGKTVSGITFTIPIQKTYTIRGFVSTNDPAQLFQNTATVVLIDCNGRPFQFTYRDEVRFTGWSPFKFRYFQIDNVLPGRYTAYASTGLGKNWYAHPVEVMVTNHSRFLFLTLTHRK